MTTALTSIPAALTPGRTIAAVTAFIRQAPKVLLSSPVLVAIAVTESVAWTRGLVDTTLPVLLTADVTLVIAAAIPALLSAAGRRPLVDVR